MSSSGTGSQLGQELATVPFDQMIKNILLAMVAGQNAANAAFIAGVNDLANATLTIKYSTSSGSQKGSNTEVTGNALAFGILPILLEISGAVITIKIDLTFVSQVQESVQVNAGVEGLADFLLFSASVNARYQNTYSFSADASSSIEIHVSPAPPPQPIMEVIKAVVAANPPSSTSGGGSTSGS
ncbi:hypothetical protein HS1genome_1130 [Sulfodiicoccus acidiphilus]|uniref:Uncharacterized protein n=1 Tax=Sulfodiicoccus acidiphilus TaxID=1670455 RepID=A0A348B3I9_9CREN|nr:hypothetical protein [Sulfodiicoccus acidiphilus]BBD72741.1 hypothetical protein HS1genome_1130 [Sulfodiicoccus acidiphilus]GGT95148.1 hypothetical protein GCM10007116_10770 [Sulfodiicoccus acidiphilus]